MRIQRRKAGAGLHPSSLLALGLALSGSGGCAARQPVPLHRLESAPRAELSALSRVVLGDVDSLMDLYHPLCPRLGVIQITRTADWERLGRAAPGLGPCPDLGQGAVIGIVSRAGTPLDGAWPVEIVEARTLDGAGFVSADFRPGTYLSDGLACVALAQCRGLGDVVVVDVNGLRYLVDP